ncbi:MAG: PIN domain-containing protein [Thermofilaceae archaeon]
MRRRKRVESSRRYVVDTSVLLECILEASPYRGRVEELLALAPRAIEIYLTPLTVAELLYTASKIYTAAGVEDANAEARNFVKWALARARVVDADVSTSLRAGELRKQFRIALPDCYAIAAAERLGAVALFLKPEREMLPKLDELRKLPLAFLAELADQFESA